MEMHGEYRISAGRETVWDALNDPAVLRTCLVGCESLEKVSESAFAAKITTKVGPIKTTFVCSLELSDIDPPNAYTLSGKGDGGTSGYAKGSVKVLLTESQEITVLSYVVDASLRGKIGQMGSRVIDSVAKRMADEFFRNLTAVVDERTGAVSEIPPATKRAGYWLLRVLIIAVIAGLVIFEIIRLISDR